MVETGNLEVDDYLSAMAYDRDPTEVDDIRQVGNHFESAQPLTGYIDWAHQPHISSSNEELFVTLVNIRSGNNHSRGVNWNDGPRMRNQTLRIEESNRNKTTHGQFVVSSVNGQTMSLDGFIWGLARQADEAGGPGKKGDILENQLYYFPESYRFKALSANLNFYNAIGALTFNTGAGTIKFTHAAVTPTIIRATYTDNNDRIYDAKTIGTSGAISGCKKAVPGPYAYKIDGTGIDNSAVLTVDSFLPSIDETENTNPWQWVCFQPQANMPAWMGGTNWMEWQYTKDADDLDAAGLPKAWNPQTQGQDAEWGLGNERLNVECAGKWVRTGDFDNESTLQDNPFGSEIVAVQPVNERAAKELSHLDYQMKVLYEYGNCQYNFARNASPTRILPNVVPVGPSPGIPAPL